MCSRYSLTSPPEAVRSYFGVRSVDQFPPRYNIAPTQPVHIVRLDPRGERELVLVRWGLIPSWVKDIGTFSALINARAETVGEKPSFRGAFRHKRCLVPTNGFYEWTGPRGAKQPHLIGRSGYELMAFAGLYEQWLGPDGSEIDSMAIITVRANAKVSAVHDRMPAILQPEHFEAWLDCRSGDGLIASQLMAPAEDGLLEIQDVSRQLNNPRNDGPELWQPDTTTLL
jgi:putative SOS response-associated peptidase YedK